MSCEQWAMSDEVFWHTYWIGTQFNTYVLLYNSSKRRSCWTRLTLFNLLTLGIVQASLTLLSLNRNFADGLSYEGFMSSTGLKTRGYLTSRLSDGYFPTNNKRWLKNRVNLSSCLSDGYTPSIFRTEVLILSITSRHCSVKWMNDDKSVVISCIRVICVPLNIWLCSA